MVVAGNWRLLIYNHCVVGFRGVQRGQQVQSLMQLKISWLETRQALGVHPRRTSVT